MVNRIIFAGTSSGVGKTTISVGIMRALRKRGYDVVPFKVGPDFIDTGFHRAATGRVSINLDSWMTGESNTRFLFDYHSSEGDFSVIEGVMGLHDGLGDEASTASTAHVSKIIRAPVILIIDGSHMAASAGAMVLGFRDFDKEVPVSGVIVNHVSTASHYQLIKEAVERTTGIPCLGYLPSYPEINLPSRHLGLIPDNETARLEERIEEIALCMERHIDLDALVRIAEAPGPFYRIDDPRLSLRDLCKGIRVGMAKDDAFSFYYEDNLDLLRYMGMDIIPFSPMNDLCLPEALDWLYLGGGFPEVFAEQLSGNVSFRKSMAAHMADGIPVYAECGGYMYLTHGIKDQSGRYHGMTGFLPGYAEMTASLQRFGYAEAVTEGGHRLRGHEFHHSRWVGPTETQHALTLNKPKELKASTYWKCGIRKENVHGAYVHLHFYSNLIAVKEIFGSLKKMLEERNEKRKI